MSVLIEEAREFTVSCELWRPLYVGAEFAVTCLFGYHLNSAAFLDYAGTSNVHRF
jgi:hypothetical protein